MLLLMEKITQFTRIGLQRCQSVFENPSLFRYRQITRFNTQKRTFLSKFLTSEACSTIK